MFNFTEYGSRIREGAFGNFVRNRYLGGKKDPMVYLVENSTVYSIGNTWKYNCTQERTITDLTEHK